MTRFQPAGWLAGGEKQGERKRVERKKWKGKILHSSIVDAQVPVLLLSLLTLVNGFNCTCCR